MDLLEFSIKESQPVTSQPVMRISAAFDGKISLIDSTGRVVASFSTGSPICSHHLSDYDPYYLSYSSDSGKKIVSLNAEDVINGTPFISEERLTVGSKKTTAAFVVDAKTGRLIGSPDSQSTEQGEGSAERHLLFITRTDYTLRSFYRNSNKDFWDFNKDVCVMKVVDIEYNFTSQNTPVNMDYELGPAINTTFEMPSANQSKVIIQRFQKINDGAISRFYLFGKGEVGVFTFPLMNWMDMGMLSSLNLPDFPDFIYLLEAKGQERRLEILNSKAAASKMNELLELVCFDGWRSEMSVSNTVIAKGSNGTIVFEGKYGGQEVAVKRLVKDSNEIQNLIASQGHPNIVRLYAVEYAQDFVYIALERCTCSLDDLILVISLPEYQISRAVIDKRHLDSVKHIMQDLWKTNRHPSPLLLKLMRDMVSGLMHLHMSGIIHGDLNPQNVLILFKEQSMSAKLSDMGIGSFLYGHWSSLRNPTTGCGSPGWQAPEQLMNGFQTQASDLFSLGCVLFYCITLGEHPFGYGDERGNNIKKNTMDLSFLYDEDIAEAGHIIPLMLNPDPALRPSALEVLRHPLFWSSKMRLLFLCDTYERLKVEDSQGALLKELESIASMVIGGTEWNNKLDMAFIRDIKQHGCYRFDSVQELLRYMRNKLSHFEELSEEIKELVGRSEEGLVDYFACRFPRLLIEVYKVVCTHCREEESLKKYFDFDV